MDSYAQISENMLNSCKVSLKVCKILGLAPYEIIMENRILKIKISKNYLFFSYCFGLFLIFFVILGLVNDLKAGKSSLKMTSTKDSVITFCDIFFIVFIVILGQYGTMFRLKDFWKFLELLKDVDKLIKTNDGIETNKKQRNKIIIILILLLFQLIYTMIVEDRTDDNYFSIKNYIVFYFLYIIVFIVEFQYWQIVASVGRRFKKLNECLMENNINNKLESSTKNIKKQRNLDNLFTIKLEQTHKIPNSDKQFKLFVEEMVKEQRARQIEKINLKRTLNFSSVEFISKISEAHGKLFEAANAINDGFGFLSLVIIMSCLFHLVVTPYFFLLDLLVEPKIFIPNLILQFLWVVTHFIRLIIIIEPCYQTCEEAKNTSPLIAKMMCSDLDSYYKKQLQIFSLQLVNRNIEFSAFGLCSIDRPLLTAIAGAITTYLVILLQFR